MHLFVVLTCSDNNYLLGLLSMGCLFKIAFVFETSAMHYQACIFEQLLGVLYEVSKNALCKDNVCVSE